MEPAPFGPAANDEANRLSRPGEEWVVLVNERDEQIGVMEKLDAHRDGGRLHRAFSVFVFDERGRMLLQRRASVKYHFPLLWTNACCGHPRPGEDVKVAARRRVGEELGVDVEVAPRFTFEYQATDPATRLSEHEIDHVFVGRLRGSPDPNPDEVDALAWWPIGDLLTDVDVRPHAYTPWFRRALEEMRTRDIIDPSALIEL